MLYPLSPDCFIHQNLKCFPQEQILWLKLLGTYLKSEAAVHRCLQPFTGKLPILWVITACAKYQFFVALTSPAKRYFEPWLCPDYL